MHVGTIRPASSLVQVESAALGTIRAATVAAFPQEGCGLLMGTPDRILAATVARNVAADPACRFEIDPAHLVDAQRRARETGPAICGCWHSHPNGHLEPSRHDAEGAAIAAWLWLITGPQGTLSLWRWSGAGFEPVAWAETPA
jgi:proteasome lid subunit RPN8/RPN11